MNYLNRAPHGIALYLSNIGKIDYRAQKIYPISGNPQRAPPETTDMQRTLVTDHDGKRLYVHLTVAGRQMFPDADYLTFEDLAHPGIYDRTVYAYNAFDGLDSLINRLVKVKET